MPVIKVWAKIKHYKRVVFQMIIYTDGKEYLTSATYKYYYVTICDKQGYHRIITL